MDAHPRLRRRLAPLVASAAAASLLLGACAGAGFTFAQSADGQAFFRVPSSWTSYGTRAMLRARHLQSPGAGQEFGWMAGFDSDPHPSTGHIFVPITDYPTVYAYQQDLTPAERDGMSLGEMRNSVYAVDQGLQSGTIHLVSANESLSYPDGFYGNRYVFDIVLRSGDPTTVRVEQTAVVDAGVRHLYVQEIACTADCFTANQHLIDQIETSWTVKER